ncbi:MAG: alpha/beta fold hydrolase [SAR202 cluster bacterium]|nr:alpha/beta fold hydrolase [SAR202 cluster bacterium]
MPYVTSNDVRIYYETTGVGAPIIFCHEFAGGYESWEPQVEYFSSRYQVVTWNVRGYPPSDVPESVDSYSQDASIEDLRAVMEALNISAAHLVGFSMGGNIALNFALKYPDRVTSLVIAGTGSGSIDPDGFRQRLEDFAAALERDGMAGMEDYTRGPQRVQYMLKDPGGWQRFADAFSRHSAVGAAFTFRGVLARRPPIGDLLPRLEQLEAPALILTGDEDDPCIEPALLMKQHIPRAGLAVFPRTGHTINLEESDLFNRSIQDFLDAVDQGAWLARDEGSGAGFSGT